MPKLRKALPKPDDKPRKKRGGKKFRNMRLKYAMTMQRKMQNVVPFGTEAQKEFRETGIGFGLLGTSGKLKTGEVVKDQKILKKKMPTVPKFPGGSSGATNGMASSLVMTPMQGMELINPDILERKVKEAKKDNYFSAKSGFSTVI